jgi:hypothetical protein
MSPAGVGARVRRATLGGMSHDANRLTGWWRRTSPGGGDKYPDHIEFRANGIYVGSRVGAGGVAGFTHWDAGRWRAPTADAIRMTTATDAELSYPYRLDGDELFITVPDQPREIRYVRER